MATIPNQLPFETDRSGITSDLRRVGILTSQRLYTDEQYKLFKQTLDVLVKYGKECLADRKALVKARLEAEAVAVAEAAAPAESDDKGDKGVGEAQVVQNA